MDSGAILITGGAKRLGRAMAEHLAREGHDLALHYRTSRDEAEALAAELRGAFGVHVVCVGADLSDRAEMARLVDRARADLGRSLTGLVNNASAFIFDRIDERGREDFEIWDQNFRTNLEAPYFLTRDFAAQCEGEGWVVNMIDQRVWRLTPNYGSYTLAKSALLTMTKTAAMALAPKIRVNAIGPGTTLQGKHQSEENFKHHRKISILERGADVEDTVEALDYLMKARVVTGQMIAVDGGQHLIWQMPNG